MFLSPLKPASMRKPRSPRSDGAGVAAVPIISRTTFNRDHSRGCRALTSCRNRSQQWVPSLVASSHYAELGPLVTADRSAGRFRFSPSPPRSRTMRVTEETGTRAE